MILLTEQVALFKQYCFEDGLCYWTDPQNGRTFFYRIAMNSPTASNNHDRPSFVFRFDVHDPMPQWQFVGELDFWCPDANVSSCGNYFWSLDLLPNIDRNGPAQPVFRQISPNTMQYTKFKVMPSGKKKSAL
jgi:hypothetical protein